MSILEKCGKYIRTAAALAAIGAASAVGAADITGAGATFPYPVYSKWAEAYKKATGTGMNYQSIGSGGGIKQIIAKTVDFGASDAPMSGSDLEKNGLTQFPMVMGGVVPVVNIQGVKPGQMRLTGAVIADIYLGKIQKWNDPAITALNPGVSLPNKGISVARSRLSSLLNLPLYDLDRLDLAATSTLNDALQQQVSAYLRQLADPESKRNPSDLTPAYARNQGRSIKPEVFVGVGICSHLGCSPSDKFQTGAQPSLPDDWQGGFLCPCHGSTFDMAGRVFKNKPAPDNLEVPPHMYLSDNKLLIGEDKKA